MSQENVEIVRRCQEFWARRDFSPITELLDPDMVIDLSRNVFNPDVYRGYDGLRHFVDAIDEMWDEFEVETKELLDAGDQVVSAVRVSAIGRDGVEVDMQVFQIWTLRDGKVVRVTGGYRDRAEALEAAGLRE
jgi:ketosteroid isomerase-like protein